MSLPKLFASTGSAGTRMYSEIGAIPVMTTSNSNTTREVAMFFVAVSGGLLIMPCMRVRLSRSNRTVACSHKTDIGVSEGGHTDSGTVMITVREKPSFYGQ